MKKISDFPEVEPESQGNLGPDFYPGYLDSEDKVESTDWQIDCLEWRNKAKNLEYRVHSLETELAWYKGYHAASDHQWHELRMSEEERMLPL